MYEKSARKEKQKKDQKVNFQPKRGIRNEFAVENMIIDKMTITTRPTKGFNHLKYTLNI